METGRQGDKETGGQGEAEKGVVSHSPCLLVSLSPCLFVWSPFLFVWLLAGCGAKPDTPPGEAPAVDKLAPEIEGKDHDGKAFKLSDYRGKVVVLSFWADW
jgi:cytochrome oxidase Cu insertion factor (SCO1/SenC/PrrC family)